MILSLGVSQNQPILASSLQTALNLSLLPSLVRTLLSDLTDAVDQRIRKTFDTASLARDAGLPASAASRYAASSKAGAGRGVEPSKAEAPLWAKALWSRLEGLIEDMSSCCIKVRLRLRPRRSSLILVWPGLHAREGPTAQEGSRVPNLVPGRGHEGRLHALCGPNTPPDASLFDPSAQVLDNKPSFLFWTTLAKTFESQSKEAARNSPFIQQTLSQGYPRLLRLFHQFFATISVHTDTLYTHTTQSPETVLVLRSIVAFETLYLSRSTARLNEVVATAIAAVGRPGASTGMQEGINVARVVANELDSAKFDPLLLRSVARNAAGLLEAFGTRIEGLYAKDHAATSMLGPMANAAQTANAQLASCLYHSHVLLVKLDYSERILTILRPAISVRRPSLPSPPLPVFTALIPLLLCTIRTSTPSSPSTPRPS